METILVERLLSILSVFSAQTLDGMSKNQICQKVCQHTSVQNKGPIFKAINLLTKEKILDAKLVNKQKKFVTPTNLGSEFINFITDINVTNEAYLSLRQKIAEYPYLIKKCSTMRSLKNILLQKGWKNEELDSFEEVIISLLRLRNVYLNNISNSLLRRYFILSSKFKMSYIANAILVRILVGGITNLLNIRPVQDTIYLDSVIPNSSFADLQAPILNDIKEEYYTTKFVSNRFTSEEISRLITSLICVLKPSSDEFLRYTNVISKIEDNKKRIESCKKDYKEYSKAAGGEILLSEDEIKQLEHNGQWKRVSAEKRKRLLQDEENWRKRLMYNLEELTKIQKNYLKRYGESIKA